ncbi:MAG: SHOCT domain-containing protein [Deltaproteobacteria bacterium]|nr:SHOCT domain-containing protein [Deltaproteobacteria bacterium]MBW2011114.1 SHOCT domain-containing protein [Deltaproteobacteria bacterium]
MAFNKKKEQNGVLKSVFVAYFILVLHVVLLVGIGLMVIFFRGIVNYIAWIFAGGSIFIIIAGYLFYRRMKKEKKSLKEMLALPQFQGRSVEVSLLGGFASLKLGKPESVPLIEDNSFANLHQLEDPAVIRIKELGELSRLLEKGLITRDEYNKAKQELFNSPQI